MDKKIGYWDLGLAVDASNVAAGATVYSNWFDNLAWVRNIKLLAQSDQQYDINYQVRDSSLTLCMDFSVGITGNAATGAGNWRSHGIGAANAILGYSARFAFKNSSASPNTFGRIRAQLIGL